MNWKLIGVEKVEIESNKYDLFFNEDNKDKLFNFLDSINLPEFPFLPYTIYERDYHSLKNKNKEKYVSIIKKRDFEKIKNKLIALNRKEKLEKLENLKK